MRQLKTASCITPKLIIFLIMFGTWAFWGNTLHSHRKILTQTAVRTINDITQFITSEVDNDHSWEAEDGLKYILVWTPINYDPMHRIGAGQGGFIRNNCSFSNCFITGDRKLLNGDVTKYDAIIFNGRTVFKYPDEPLPERRSPQQKYIYYNMESTVTFPVLQNKFDRFFNWTLTYKLKSDIPSPYILIQNKKKEKVGPKEKMSWIENMEEVDEELSQYLTNKKHTAAWIVSHCKTSCNRETYVGKLQKALKQYGLHVDVYGKCGVLNCTKSCREHIRSYHFYLSFENTCTEDYVTEKLLHALHYDAVPIVYGASDYSRFLPPNSYLNAMELSPDQLAARMNEIIQNQKLYLQFFRWRNHYTYRSPQFDDNLCSLCAALNNKDMFQTPTVYKDFRAWWR